MRSFIICSCSSSNVTRVTVDEDETNGAHSGLRMGNVKYTDLQNFVEKSERKRLLGMLVS
jgi:hypothetical protein